jgi:hypothetical protein
LRESWEEMRLLPWVVEFLGLLPMYRLQLFDRWILPLVGRVPTTLRIRPNWEVDKIVPIPVSNLLCPDNHAVCLLRGVDPTGKPLWGGPARFPCFVHRDEDGVEILWGATYHIVLSFLHRVFAFEPPSVGARHEIPRALPSAYLTGGGFTGGR